MLKQLALNTNTYHGYSVEEAIIGAANAGFKQIELAAVADHTAHVRPHMEKAYLQSIKDLLMEYQLRVIGISAHSNIMKQEGIDNLLETIELANYFDCQYITTATGDSHGDTDIIEDDSTLLQMLIPVLNKCQKDGKQLLIETHGNNYATGAHLKRFISTLTAQYKDSVKINYDTANVLFYGGVMPYKDLEEASDQVAFIHLKDKAGKANEWNFPAIGEGDFDIEKIMNILKQAHFKGPISVEIEFTPAGPGSLEMVHEASQKSYQYLQGILK